MADAARPLSSNATAPKADATDPGDPSAKERTAHREAASANGRDAAGTEGDSSDKEPPKAEIDPRVNVRAVTLTLIAAAATMYVLHWAREMFIPIVVGILISYALEPVVAWLTRMKLPRPLAAAAVVLSLTGSFAYTGYMLSGNAAAVVAELPEAAIKLRDSLRQMKSSGPSTLEQVERAAEELQKTADEVSATPSTSSSSVQQVQVVTPTFDVRGYLSWGSASLLAFAGQAVLVVFFVFFLLASGDLFKRKLVKIAGPTLSEKKITVQILDDINTQIARFLFVRVVTSLIVGIASWLAFRYVGLENAGVWGILAGVFNSIPYFGPVIVTAGVSVVAFLEFGTIGMAAWVGAISLAITSIEGWVLTPWLTSRASRTNEVAVFVSLIFWGFLWGIWGTLLAVPMLVVAKACCDRIEDLKPVGEMLGD
jgi:predicted PurR-regulated permease PerM